MNLPCDMPCWYVVVMLLWSAFQGFRGVTEHRINSKIPTIQAASGNDRIPYVSYLQKCWERWVVLYVHDFAYRFVCTAAGFVALYGAHAGLKHVSMKEPAAGALIFVAFAFIVGVIGVGGQLHNILLWGKLPWMKG